LLGSDTRRCLRCEDNTRHVPAGVPALSTRSSPTADEVPPPAWPRLPHLPLLRRGGWQGKPGCSSFATGGKLSSSSPTPGEPTTVVVVVLRGEKYHVVAAVAGHELESPKAEHRPRLKRLLKATHMELQRESICQHAVGSYLARQLSAFRTRVDHQPTSEFVAACPCPDGLMQDGTQAGRMRLILSCTEVLVVGVTSVAREREREREGLALR
jgi:hypothetical protein